MSKFFKLAYIKKPLILDTCICNTCEYYYDIYEAKTGITNRKKETDLSLKQLCYCANHMVGLPFFQDDTGKLCPDVISCTNYKKRNKKNKEKK